MIELSVIYPRIETSESAIVNFVAKQIGGEYLSPDADDLTPAAHYIAVAIRNHTSLELDANRADEGVLALYYNPSLSSWRDWYMIVLNAICKYYDENYDTHGYHQRLFEVVSNTQPSRSS